MLRTKTKKMAPRLATNPKASLFDSGTSLFDSGALLQVAFTTVK